MGLLIEAWNWLHSPTGANLLLALFALSEALGGIEAIKQSSVYQLVLAGFAKILELLGLRKAS